MISVIILTYKQHEALEVCLRSALLGQRKDNQIIVVENGYWEPNEKIFQKYQSRIDILRLEENVGMMRAMNLGTYNASNEFILHVHDDNIFPLNWDESLLNHFENKYDYILSPNQIEPRPSMFKQFHIKDLGTVPSEFNLNEYWDYEQQLSTDVKDQTGGTFPFMMRKIDYLKLGGFDESYPGPWVVDWEFFLKCNLNRYNIDRTYKCHFYHFGSLATTSPEKQKIEQECHEFAIYKWGTNIKHHPHTNLKYL